MAHDTFTAAVEDSYLLLAFLSRRSLTMDRACQLVFTDHADTMARTQTQVAAAEAISATDRVAFWKGFHALSQLASPVTIENIRRYLKAHHARAGLEARTARKGRMPALASEARATVVSLRPAASMLCLGQHRQ